MSGRPPLSVVVPTRDRAAMLDGCLRPLRAVLAAGDELLVVDSASADDGTRRAAERYGAGYLRCEQPGASRARNAGWRAARHPLVAFVDDDVRVLPGWADAMVAALDRPDVSFVTGRVDVDDLERQVVRPVAVKTDDEPAVLHAGSRGTLGASASLAARREALERVGGFDERLGPGTWFAAAEDVDLFDRLFAAGCTGRYEPAARAEHVQWRTRGQLLTLDWGYGKGEGARVRKLWRADRARARELAGEVLWRAGVVVAVRDLRKGFQLGFVLRTARVLGVLAGLAVATARLRRDPPWG